MHYDASNVRLLFDPQEEWALRLGMIRAARCFLYISTYFIQYDRYGLEFTEALIEARGRGVEVVLLVDDFGQKLSSNLMTGEERLLIRTVWDRLRAAGVRLQFYRCKRVLQRVLGSGMHIKIQLSEQGGALFSSGNITGVSYEKWREFSAYVEGAIVLRLLDEFADLGMEPNETHRLQLQQVVGKAKVDPVPFGYMSYNPVPDPHFLNPVRMSQRNTLTDYLAECFDAARTSISLTSLYFKPPPALLEAIMRAAGRGVKIEIFHSHRDALGPSIIPWIPSYHLYAMLLDAGVHVYENRGGEHSKIILLDGKTAIFGSYNLEYAAHDRIAEAMMVSQQGEHIERFEAMFSQLRVHSNNQRVDEGVFALPWDVRVKTYLFKPLYRWV